MIVIRVGATVLIICCYTMLLNIRLVLMKLFVCEYKIQDICGFPVGASTL